MVVFCLMGSQRSFITIDVFPALDLNVILNERLFLNVFGDREQKIQEMVVAELFVKCCDGGIVIVEALVMLLINFTNP